MRKLLLTAVALLMMTAPAFAGWNIRQNDDGTADWVNGFGETVPIGATYLTQVLDDVSTASTAFFVVPITAAKLTLVQTSLGGAITGSDAAITVSSNYTGSFVSTTAATFAVGWSGSTTGDVDSLVPTSGNELEQGTVIAVHTDGGSTNTIPLTITLSIEPKR